MIDPKQFLNHLQNQGVGFFSGVPDSLLKPLNAVFDKDPRKHIIAANEGAAIALGIGDYLATNRIPMVYMQNSGLGNAINPLMSLAHSKIYSIPMLLLIGWRGEPGQPDEPQHQHVGASMLNVLEGMGLPYKVLHPSWPEVEFNINEALLKVKNEQTQFALVIPKGFFASQKEKPSIKPAAYELTREQALRVLCQHAPKEARFFATTGYLGRELYELRESMPQLHKKDFLCIGGMGHTSQVALGYALKSKHPVFCLDGDGAMLMHMGSFALCGAYAPKSYVHVLFNNGVHDSVGAQPTIAHGVDWCAIAKACGFKQCFSVSTKEGIDKIKASLSDGLGPVFVELKVAPGAREDLGRPKLSPLQQKEAFMKDNLDS